MMISSADFDEILRQKIQPNNGPHATFLLQRAMHYALFNGGKRIRPLLVYFTGQIFDTPIETLHHPACAVELIHTYSLIHDDLPAMDNDDYRRGKPTCHKAFDEATAILAGDALQALAFQLLSTPSSLTPTTQLKMIHQLSMAIGAQGMAGGQSLDLLAEGKQLSIENLNQLHQWKTGALIKISVEIGILASNNSDDLAAERLRQFASCLGLGFQIKDDIKDVEGDLVSLGKPPGGDIKKQKATYPAILGLAEAKDSLKQLHEQATSCLQPFGRHASSLQSLLNSML